MFWIFKKAYCRVYQKGLNVVCLFLDWREPTLIKGAGSIKTLPAVMKQQSITKVLIVTDEVIENLHLLETLIDGLDKLDIKHVVFNGVQPNPSVENMEEARRLYVGNSCDAIIGFGGGSPMDCAKVAAARVTNPQKTIRQLKGVLKVRHKLPPLFAVPTTAGTGSESTVAALVKDMATHEKYAVMDSKLRPRYAVLDPELTLTLPPHLTASTGMDALTHAVEAFIGKSNTKHTAEYARKTVKLVFQNIEKAYLNGNDIEAREKMLLAANYGGLAFTRAYVGYVHAFAHTVGGIYGTSHGLANAIVLPFVLEYFGDGIYKKLAELADIAGLTKESQSDAEKANAFINAIKEMKQKMDIPEHLTDIKEEDIPLIVKRALHEGNPLYPVPKIMNKADCEAVVRRIMG